MCMYREIEGNAVELGLTATLGDKPKNYTYVSRGLLLSMPTVYSIKGAGIRGLLLSIPTVYSIKRVFLYRDFLQQVAVNRVPLLT